MITDALATAIEEVRAFAGGDFYRDVEHELRTLLVVMEAANAMLELPAGADRDRLRAALRNVDVRELVAAAAVAAPG